MTKQQADKLEMKDDGNDADRFKSLLKTVVNVPKEDIKKYEAREKAKKDKSRSHLFLQCCLSYDLHSF